MSIDLDGIRQRLEYLMSRVPYVTDDSMLMASLDDIAALLAEVERLRKALQLFPRVMRPWIDAQIGRAGTVTYPEWEAAMKQIDEALEREGQR